MFRIGLLGNTSKLRIWVDWSKYRFNSPLKDVNLALIWNSKRGFASTASRPNEQDTMRWVGEDGKGNMILSQPWCIFTEHLDRPTRRCWIITDFSWTRCPDMTVHHLLRRFRQSSPSPCFASPTLFGPSWSLDGKALHLAFDSCLQRDPTESWIDRNCSWSRDDALCGMRHHWWLDY